MLCKDKWRTISFLVLYTVCEVVPNPLNYLWVMTDFMLCDESYAILSPAKTHLLHHKMKRFFLQQASVIMLAKSPHFSFDLSIFIHYKMTFGLPALWASLTFNYIKFVFSAQKVNTKYYKYVHVWIRRTT